MSKLQSIYITVNKVAQELNIDLIDAASKIQEQAAKEGNDEMIAELHGFKMKTASQWWRWAGE